jgi:hypothetical protein
MSDNTNIQDDEIKISYESLFEIAGREKSSGDLQKLSSGFYSDLLGYLKDKHELLKSRRAQPGDMDKARKIENVIININNIVRDIYEKRERKILNMALNKSRTKSEIIDTSGLLAEEKRLFNDLLVTLDLYRKGIFENITNLRPVEIRSMPKDTQSEEKPGLVMVRFTHAVPKFLSKKMKPFGPFEEDDVASLPSDVAEILIAKKRAEQIKSR